MRVSTLLPIALAAGTAVASKQGTLGFALGNKNADSSCKSQSDYEKDFDALKGVTTLVRTYSASDCDTAKNIIPAAKAKQFKVVLGVWPDYDQSFNQDFSALKASVHGNEDVVDAITVGSEVLYRKGLTADNLLKRIQQVQNEFPQVTVGFVDSWNKIADGTADPIIKGGVNYILANGFAYWQGQELSNATNTYFDDMAQALEHIEKVAPNPDKIRFGNGETGWPTTGGSNYGPAVASTENAATYYQSAVCGILDWGIDVFYFEAFDEAWKPDTKGDNGEMQDEKHWGAFSADRKVKFDLKCNK
ncbi:1,3-beta-glucanosyltransferase Bgt1 [Aspergillus clavatus NRRL 1]|uniref:glucan 1,3-beta-glucosidase n=1 Tax=Aspergillus clavatus (strain ATCC 1007 / CBS 513.65 / DSM 816 / NCTC 3887 / NRRL 1 / QM 1276 / 107) TaxID=344612 RepID=A1CPY5_ASPCL|nr:1,3-beta-glucanosyltransferase Bgt1 [Aspergillus clavatus NRRL 1]EAW07706.1 1,3-beta-glucanosyltransferase Bgt1 [Aspergillus clavatus NRRL 1]